MFKLPKRLKPVKLDDVEDAFVSRQYEHTSAVTPSGFCDIPSKQCTACENGTQTCVIPGSRYGAFTCPC